MIRVEGYGWEEERGAMEKGDRKRKRGEKGKKNKPWAE